MRGTADEDAAEQPLQCADLAAQRGLGDEQSCRTSLREVSWLDSPIEVVGTDRVAEEKAAAGKSIAILGSSTLTAALLRDGLVDELHLMVHPIHLGGGRKLFDGTRPVPLELAGTRPFESGNVLLTYRPVRD